MVQILVAATSLGFNRETASNISTNNFRVLGEGVVEELLFSIRENRTVKGITIEAGTIVIQGTTVAVVGIKEDTVITGSIIMIKTEVDLDAQIIRVVAVDPGSRDIK